MAIFDVNTDEVINLTAKLEKLHRSAFPSAVRNTLNNVAFEHKRLIPVVAKQKFVNNRSKTFFKKVTGVVKAKDFNVNKMVAISGLDENIKTNEASGLHRVINNLEAQEKGGSIKSRKLITHSDSRISGNSSRRISRSSRHDKVDFHDGTKAFKSRRRRSNKGSAFVSAVMSAKKAGHDNVLIKGGRHGKIRGVVYKIGKVKRKKNGYIDKFKAKKIYSYTVNENYNNNYKRTFISSSGKLASKQIQKIYKEAAEFQFKKALK